MLNHKIIMLGGILLWISLEFLDNWLNSMDEIKKEVENDIDREVYEC